MEWMGGLDTMLYGLFIGDGVRFINSSYLLVAYMDILNKLHRLVIPVY